MINPSDYRQRYGPVYIIELNDGTVVPFNLLSLKDYFEYSKALAFRTVSPEVLENEIFLKCVKDEILVRNIHKLKAGTISSIVEAIRK